MLFGLSHEEKIEKMNLLHFPVFTSKKFCDFKIAGTIHWFIAPAVVAGNIYTFVKAIYKDCKIPR